MKTFNHLTLTLLLVIFALASNAQGDLSILMGIHPYGKAYDMTTGRHAAIQYNISCPHAMRYGLIAQHSRFSQIEKAVITPQISSLSGFASFAFIENSRMKSYIKMEVGAAYASTKSRLEERVAAAKTIPSHFIAAQFNPAIGAEINLSNAFTMQIEYKNMLHYGHAEVATGGYNFGSLDLGINYKFYHKSYHKKSYARTKTRCKYNRKTGATSCYSFR